MATGEILFYNMSEHSLKEVFLINQTRKLILETALKLFSQKGYNNTSTKEIAEKAGIAEGTIFNYFSTKQELLKEVASTGINMFAESYFIDPLRETINKNTGSSLEILVKEVLRNRVELFKEYLPLIKLLIIESQNNPEIKEIFADQVIRKGLEMGEKILELGEGQFRDLNSVVVVRSVMGMLITMVIQRELLPDKIQFSDIEGELTEMIDLIFYGLKKERKQHGE